MKVAQNIFAILWRDLGNRGRGCLRPSSKCDYERKRQQRAQVTPGSGNLHRVPHQSGLSQLQYTVRIDPVERAKDASGASSVKPCSSVPPITSVPLRPAPGKHTQASPLTRGNNPQVLNTVFGIGSVRSSHFMSHEGEVTSCNPRFGN